jgi:prophage antirepressor-like protein
MSLNELAISFKKIVDELFSSQGFECRKLFYGDEVFYCGRDILKCLGYSEEKRKVYESLNKLREEDKFTIGELEEKYYGTRLTGYPDIPYRITVY